MQRAVAAVPLVLVPALGAAQGGFSPDTWVWSGALAAWGAAVVLVVGRRPGALRRGWPWAVSALLLLGWTALSAVWSTRASQSILDARRTVVYAAVVLALVLLARRGANAVLVPATQLAIAGLLLYALARYLLGARRSDEFEGYTLHQPLGYANAAGILAVLGLLLALGLVADGGAVWQRAAAGASTPVLAAALVLAQSNASELALAVGVLVVLLVSRAPVRTLAAAAVVLAPTAAAAGLSAASGIATDAEPSVSRGVVAAVVGAAAVTAAALVVRTPLPSEAESPRLRRLLVVACVILLAGGGAAAAHSGASEPRASYYDVAWSDQVRGHPLLGTGAGTFGLYWVRSGEAGENGGALDAHSLYLETLAELGPVGLLLLLAFLAAPLRGLLRRRGSLFVPAAAGAYAAFLVHAGLDWDWEMPAVVVAALCAAGAVAAAELGDDERPFGAPVRAALLVAAAALGACAIAGTRSNTEPGAAKAPQRGAFARSYD
jgi:hypothetical protein